MENNTPFAQYSDEPLYNIQAVAEQTDVPALTLRAWERRYEIPMPKRDTQGHRLYSERDMMMIKWLKQQVDASMRIKQAVQLLRSQNPQYLGATLTPPAISSNAPIDSQFEQLVDNLYLAIQNFDYPQSQLILTHALSIYSIEDVSLGIIVPVFAKIDEGFVTGEFSLQAEHFGSNLIRERLLGILTTPSAPLRAGRIVVGCTPHEWHEIGALIFSLFLRRRGWEVIYLGQNVGFSGLAETIHQLNPDIFTLSITHLPNLRYLAEAAQIVNEATAGRGIFSFAGHVFGDVNIIPIVDQLPGIFLGYDLISAVEKIEDLLGRRWQSHEYHLPELPAQVEQTWQFVYDNQVVLEGVLASLIAEVAANDAHLEVSLLAQQFINMLLASLQFNHPELNAGLNHPHNITMPSLGMAHGEIALFVDRLVNYWESSAPPEVQATLLDFTKWFNHPAIKGN